MGKVTWKEFLAELVSDITKFDEFWAESHLKNPKDFPATLSRGDWEEQFLVFVSSNEST